MLKWKIWMENKIKYTIFVIVSLLIISIILSFFMSFTQALRIVFGSVYVLFLPGFILTYAFFPRKLNKKTSIDWIERIALSFALSIAIVPLTVFYLNKIGIKINLLNSFLTILIIIIISLGIIIYKKKS